MKSSKKTKVLFFPVLIAMALPQGHGNCQNPVVYRIEGQNLDELGDSVAVLGDVDGDRVREFAATTRNSNHRGNKGRIDLFSGKTRKIIRSWIGDDTNFFRGSELGALPDMDEDGLPELGVASVHLLYAISPVTGRTFYAVPRPITWGEIAAFIQVQDLDGDKVGEFAFGDPYFDVFEDVLLQADEGGVTLHSGKTGRILWHRAGPKGNSELGWALLEAGDFDGDGITDILAGAPAIHPEEDYLPGDPAVYLLSTRTGEVLQVLLPPGENYFWFGFAMVSLGDRDGNGFPEIAIAAPQYGDRGPSKLDGSYGWVGLYHLPDFRLERTFVGRDPTIFSAGDLLGYSMAAADVDGDGILDLLLGTWRLGNDTNRDNGRLYIHSGATWNVLKVYEGKQDSLDFQFFQGLYPLGDIDGDGRSEFLVSSPVQEYHDAPNRDRSFAGAIRLLRYIPGGPRFLRGDTDADGRLTVTDVVNIVLSWIYKKVPPCPAAYDVNVDGKIGPRDALDLFNYLFVPFNYSPSPPFPECGGYLMLEPEPGFRDLPCDDPGACAGNP